MRRAGYFCFVITCLIIMHHSGSAAEDPMVILEGEYLAFSYDHNQLYGEKVHFTVLSYNVYCPILRIDFASGTFYGTGRVTLSKSGEADIQADEFLFQPHDYRGLLLRYGDTIEETTIGKGGRETLRKVLPAAASISLEKIQNSLFYFTGKHMEIAEDFDVFGRNITLYIEGFESFGLKRFKLSEGINKSQSGLSLDKIWFNKSQGVIASIGYDYRKENKITSSTQLDYEEHSVLKDYQGLPRQVDIRTDNLFRLEENLNLGIDANYNSSSQWNSRLSLTRNWGEKKLIRGDITFNKPINQKGETWLGFLTDFTSAKWGEILLSGRYELRNQMLADLSYRRELFKNTLVQLRSNFSKIRIHGTGTYSQIFSGGIDFLYNSRMFNLSANYFLNHDLFGRQLLSQPQMKMTLNPFSFYGGLLTASIDNVFIWNQIRLDDVWQNTYSNNTMFKLSSRPLSLRKDLTFRFDLALEQFLEKEGRNFTSGGLILNARKGLGSGFVLEGFYSYQSRRKTRGWLIEGTSSQDLSSILRFIPSHNINAWISLSYDPKTSQFRQSLAEVSLDLIKNWKFHSLVNYDFLLKKVSNIDLYLIRMAGRFQIRFIWRSISRQILIELVPN